MSDIEQQEKQSDSLVRRTDVRKSTLLRSHRYVLTICWGAIAFLAGSLPLAWADIYTYVDKDGVSHFTNSPKKGDKWKVYSKSNERVDSKKTSVTPYRSPNGGGADRYTRYDATIREAAAYYQIPEALVRAVIRVESDFDPAARSHAGAQGLMQIMPETAIRMQIRDVWDPRENIFGGTRLLRVLANMFNGDLDLTLAAYNSGPGTVTRAGGIPNIAETQNYVVKVKQFYRQYRVSTDVSHPRTP